MAAFKLSIENSRSYFRSLQWCIVVYNYVWSCLNVHIVIILGVSETERAFVVHLEFALEQNWILFVKELLDRFFRTDTNSMIVDYLLVF